MKRLFLLAVFAMFAIGLSAQPPIGKGKGDGDNHVPGTPSGIPIDGGITLLIAAGAAYGAKKFNEKI